MASRRKIGSLAIGEVRYSGDLAPFWQFLGRTVTQMAIREFSPYTMRSYLLANEIIAQFQRLERLKLENYHVDRQMMRTSVGTYTAKWPSVRTLVIDSLKIEPEHYEFFKEVMPGLQNLEIGMYQGNDEEFMNKYLRKFKKIFKKSTVYLKKN